MKGHKKICWNCEGYVHIYELQCPYCGVDLSPSSGEDVPENQHTAQDELESHIPPPYSQLENIIDEENKDGFEKEENFNNQEYSSIESESSLSLTPLILLLPGSVLFLFGIALFLFAYDGVLTLTFDAKYWFMYLFASVPLIYFGFKPLFPQREKEEPAEKPAPFATFQANMEN